MSSAELTSRLDRFKADLTSCSVSKIVRKVLTSTDSYILTNDLYYDLKEQVAEHFNIHPSVVLMVGSGRLGFSLAPEKRYRFFCNESDIDMTIVSAELFDRVWELVVEYQGDWPERRAFQHYLFNGWIRPDKLPQAGSFDFTAEWWNFFKALTSCGKYGEYKITAGIYRSWYFIEKYQGIRVKECQDELGGI
jgi:hypothetical protein